MAHKNQSTEGAYVYEDPKTGELFHYSRKGSYRKNGRSLIFKGKAHILNLVAHNAGKMNEYVFDSKEEALKMAKKIGLSGAHSHKTGDGKTLWMPGKNMKEFKDWYDKHSTKAKDYTISDETGACWEGYERVPNTKKGTPGSCRKKGTKAFIQENWDEEGIEYLEAAEYQGRKVTLNKPFLTPKGPKKRSVYVKNDKGNVVKVNFGDPNMRIKKSDPERRKNFRARHNCDNPGPKWKARYWSCKMW